MLALLLGGLTLWPRHYRAETELMPQDSGGGLSSALAQQGAGAILDLGALVGGKQSIEADLTIAKSHAVIIKVIDKLHLVGRPGFGTPQAAENKLKRKMDIIAVRGSILQITVRDADPAFAKAFAEAVATSIQDRLADLSLLQADQRRAVASNRLREANLRLATAQSALSRFQLANKLPSPETQLGQGLSRLAGLEAQLQAKELELNNLQQVATGNNIQVQVVQSAIAGLRQQIARAQNTTGDPLAPKISDITQANAEYFNIYREEQLATILQQVYIRYMEELEIDELSIHQNLNIIEPAYVDPKRQYNTIALALLIVVLMAAVAAEFYVVRPPVGRR